jgi:hypothetical protein
MNMKTNNRKKNIKKKQNKISQIANSIHKRTAKRMTDKAKAYQH